MSRTLLRGGCVLTLGAKTPNFMNADVLIEDDRIVEVGEGLRSRDAEVVDATDTVVMPGFIDSHRHVWRSLFRTFGDAGSAAMSRDVGAFHEPDDIYAATLVGLLGAIECGTTTVVDWSDIPVGDAFVDAAIQAHADAGLRTVYIAAPPTWAGTESGDLATIRRVNSAAGGQMSIAHGSGPSLRRDTIDTISSEWVEARNLGVRIHTHAGAGPTDGGAVVDLKTRGLLGDDVTLIHCSHLSGPDLDAIESAGAGVILTPSTEMTDGMGAPPVQALLDHGIDFGLGVDNVTEAPSDIFAQMRATISLQHATFFDLKLAGKAGLPNMMTTRSSIKQATIHGATAVGLGEVTGSLEPGKQADIIMLRTDRPNILPVNDPIGAVVWGMDTSNLDSVFVAGRALMSNGVLAGDVSRARSLADAAFRRVASSAGLLTDTTTGGGS